MFAAKCSLFWSTWNFLLVYIIILVFSLPLGKFLLLEFFWLLIQLLIKEFNTLFYGRYRRKRDKLVDRAGAAQIPTMWGPFTSYCYRSLLDGMEHIAMVKVSSACFLIDYI